MELKLRQVPQIVAERVVIGVRSGMGVVLVLVGAGIHFPERLASHDLEHPGGRIGFEGGAQKDIPPRFRRALAERFFVFLVVVLSVRQRKRSGRKKSEKYFLVN